ncbi:hypothetical protein HYV88_00805 [Candidatus Woesearchaeota archaeon]|nr:hypothetical protein [Candidatus Woesearchaeota archaeon]
MISERIRNIGLVTLLGVLTVGTYCKLMSKNEEQIQPEVKLVYGARSGMVYTQDPETTELRPTWFIDHNYLGGTIGKAVENRDRKFYKPLAKLKK